MASLNIFRNDAFSMLELTSSVERIPYLPSFLGDLGIFTPNPIRTTALAVEERTGQLSLVPLSQRGEPPANDRTTELRKLRYFEVPRLLEGDTVQASEIQNIRAFGEDTAFMQVQDEVMRRLAGPTGLINLIQYTWEYQRLAAIQGLLLDSDGSVRYNWFDEFQITAPVEVGFNLAGGLGTLKHPINTVTRGMWRAAKGAFIPGRTKIYALCGDGFWDAFVNHPDVIQTYANWEAAATLRDKQAFEEFYFLGIYWVNYRGSDDNSTIKIADDKVRFFPVDAPGVFEKAMAPSEAIEYVNTPGKDYYVLPIFDLQRNFWWRMEVYSYPLFICKRPEVLFSGRSEP